MEKLFNMLKAAGGLLTPRRALQYATATVAALLAISTIGLTATAQTGGTTVRGVPNIVLVHGAWADGSSWSGVIERLQKAGFNVTAVQISLNSLADDVAVTRRVLADQDGPTLLVAHSYGGAVITELGTDAPNVKGLVYLAAFGPDQGESLQGLLGQGPPLPWLATVHPDQGGYLWLSEEAYVKYFAADVDPVQARVMFATQKPANAALFAATFGVPSWKTLPSFYIVAENDQILPAAAQRLMAGRMKATISSVAGSHVSMVSHPDEVASMIDGAASSLIPDPRPNVTAVPATPTAAPVTIPGSGSQTFSETGKTVTGLFLDYWRANGGLAQQGYPISDLMTEKSPLDGKEYTVQYFERAVFEYHPENQPPYNVLLSQLGTFRYKEIYQGNAAKP